jgi:hypothetical protein
MEVVAGPYGPGQVERVVIVTTDPSPLPDLTTWYLVTNVSASGPASAPPRQLTPRELDNVVGLYGLRQWVEQGYKQVKYALGWAQYQVRSDRAVRRHWQLVCCAFSFCWYHLSHPGSKRSGEDLEESSEMQTIPVLPLPAPQRKQEKEAVSKAEIAHRCPGLWRCEWYEHG